MRSSDQALQACWGDDGAVSAFPDSHLLRSHALARPRTADLRTEDFDSIASS